MSSIRHPTAGWTRLLLLGLGLWSCGRTEPEGRFAVVERNFTWTPVAGAVAPADRAPRSRTWAFDAPQPEWTVTPGAAAQGEGALLLEGVGKVGIAGPGRRVVDDELLHWVNIRLSTTTAHSLELRWHGSPPRSFPLEARGEPESVTVALESLKGIVTTDEAQDLSIVAVGAPDQPVRVTLEQIGLVSDYESAGGQGFVAAELVRAGVRRSGVALLAPGAVQLDVPAAAGDRLRFALAVVGGDGPVDVTLSDAGGRLPAQTVRCTPGASWSEHALALPDEPPGPVWQLVFRADAPADSTAIVLIGSPLLLRRSAQTRQVVLYVEDTLRADHLQTLGYPRPTDPHLRRIAEGGTTFTRTWSSSNWTRPAVSSLLTGLDPIGHGNRGNAWRVADALVTLPEVLAGAGSVTASFVTNYHGGSWSGLEQGFDSHADPAAFDSYALPSTLTSALIRGPIEAFLAEHHDESFFVYAHSLDPHSPYLADEPSLVELAGGGVPLAEPAGPPEAVRRIGNTMRQYDGEIRHNDRELGLLKAALDAHGLTADTLFVFVADHGEAFFEHGQWEHRHTLHEEEVRVPWIMQWPARLPAGLRLDLPASLVDVAPTMLGLLGLEIPPDWRGRDLSALCLDRNARLHPAPVFIDSSDYPPDEGKHGEAALVAWPHKLIVLVAQDGTLTPTGLYRLDHDPQERHNLLESDGAGGAPLDDLLDELRARLEAGPAAEIGAARAADVSPELEAWMRQMGYLR